MCVHEGYEVTENVTKYRFSFTETTLGFESFVWSLIYHFSSVVCYSNPVISFSFLFCLINTSKVYNFYIIRAFTWNSIF